MQAERVDGATSCRTTQTKRSAGSPARRRSSFGRTGSARPNEASAARRRRRRAAGRDSARASSRQDAASSRSPRRVRAAARRMASRSRSNRAAIASANAAGSADATAMPQPGSTISPRPPASRTTIGVPQASASSADRPKVSWSPACTNTSALASAVASESMPARKGSTRTRSPAGGGAGPAPMATQHVRRAEPRHRGGEHVEVLLRREAPGVDEHARLRVEALRDAPGGRSAGRMKARRVDAERLAGDALDAPVEKMAAHAAARCQHQIEAGIEMLRVAPRQPRRGRAEARAGGQARHLLEVRMAVGDGRQCRARGPHRARSRQRDTGRRPRSGRAANLRGRARPRRGAAAGDSRRCPAGEARAAKPRRSKPRCPARRSCAASPAGVPATRAWPADSAAHRRPWRSRTSSHRRRARGQSWRAGHASRLCRSRPAQMSEQSLCRRA